MKKTILILLGISVLLIGVIYVLYKNSESKNEEIIDIFKEDSEELTVEEEIKEDIISKVFVDIKGMVANPGVYEMSVNSRVNDVIIKAGGLVDGADTSFINLAKIVTDEMTIIIHSTEEIKQKYKEEICVCNCPEITNDACIEEKLEKENNLVNINTADKDELMLVSGIGESKANSIIKYRETNGLFSNIEEIKNVSGIGDSLFEEIKDHITV